MSAPVLPGGDYIGRRYGDLAQMSYITRDMDAAVDHAASALGLTGLTVTESEIPVLSYGQKRTLAVKAAIGNVPGAGGTRQFEIIQPVSGATEIYTDAVDLSAHILNFHHVGIAVPGPYAEWEKLMAEVRASGDEFAYLFPEEPGPDAKLCFCYVDTRKRLGHYTEFLWADPSLKGIAAAPWL